ncbi:MAG: GntR family transcriptional regulator [Geminicoccaceae bacterium]
MARGLEREDDQAGAFSVTPPLRSKSSAERVVTQIIDLIRSGNVRAGDWPPSETELAKAFQVSRPVIREALRGLAILGVVEDAPGRALAHVTDLTIGTADGALAVRDRARRDQPWRCTRRALDRDR